MKEQGSQASQKGSSSFRGEEMTESLNVRPDAPRAVFVSPDHPNYHRMWAQQLPAGPGIYMVCADDRVLYIGTSCNMRSRWRLRNACDKRRFWDHGANSISWIPLNNAIDSWLIEDALIRRYQPLLNRRPSIGDNGDYRKGGKWRSAA